MFGGLMDYIQNLVGGGGGNAGVGLLPGKSLDNVGLNPNMRGGAAGLMPGDQPNLMGRPGGGLPGLLGGINIAQLMSRGGIGGAGGGLGAALGGLGGLGGLGVQMMQRARQQAPMPTAQSPVISMMKGSMGQNIQDILKRYRGGM